MKTTTLESDCGNGSITFVEEAHGICVVMLSVKRGHRMRGIAGQLLARLCAYADAQRLTIHLSVVALDHGPDCLPFGLLREWYMKRGFRDQHGPDGYSEHLYRLPIRKMVVNKQEGKEDRNDRVSVEGQD